MTRAVDGGLTAEISYGAPFRDDWPDAHPYTVTLRYQQRAMTVPFYAGPAWSREPELDDVMDCLCSDALCVINTSSFEDWANELGFDSESRRAERTYQQVQQQTQDLRQLLGDDFEQTIRTERWQR